MRYRVEYLDSALSDIASALEYISFELQNPVSGQKLVNKIFRRCDALDFAPKGSRVRLTVKGKDFRYIHIDNFTAVYYVDETEKKVKIYAVIYSRRDIPNILKNKGG